MLFNSYEFIFLFLPVVLAGFFVLGRLSRSFALGWLTLASLVFYAWWRPLNVFIIAPSILVNYGLARWLRALASDERRTGSARAVLLAGVAFNIAFLGYFKYVNFLSTVANDLMGTHFVMTQVILPLGISFITFQKIAFLVDVHGGRIRDFSFRDYGLFVLFFPQLIAGPIVHYRELMPQFEKASGRLNLENLAVGLTLFAFGLFKKIVLADGVAEFVAPPFETASSGVPVGLIESWIAALGFTLQIYFDFSGYSDMALGLARCFGVRLPANFDSPLKSTSIIDFWLRWHMTLTRFLTAYLYNPMVMWLTRRRMAKKLPGLGGKSPKVGAFLQLLAGPTLLTMLVSGIWHGAGYLFMAWGLLHGIYLCINHAWRLWRPRFWPNAASYERRMRPLGFALTFIAVAGAMIVFRAPNAVAACDLLQGMAGLNGLALPDRLQALAGASLHWITKAPALFSSQELSMALAWVFVLTAVALTLPNTLQIMARYEPATGLQNRPAAVLSLGRLNHWAPSLPWLLLTSMLAVAAVMRLGGKSEFLYWQF